MFEQKCQGAVDVISGGERISGDHVAELKEVLEARLERGQPLMVLDIQGVAVMDSAGCLLCHTVDGVPGSAPTFKGLAGSQRPLESGEFVTADDAYLLNSILDPSSQIVQGYSNLMPETFGDTLTEDQINDVIAYIKSLS